MKEICREVVLAACDRPEHRNHRKEFDLWEIVKEVFASTIEFKESTIRTHVLSKMCIQAPTHHAMKHDDLDRIEWGKYRSGIWSTNQN